MSLFRPFVTCVVALLVVAVGQAAPPEAKPVLVPVWKKSTVGLAKEDDINWDHKRASVEWLTKLYERVITNAHERSRPVIPPATPVVRNQLVLHSNDEAIVARGLVAREFPENKTKIKAGELYFQYEGHFGLMTSAREWSGRVLLNEWLSQKDAGELCDRMLNRTLSHVFAAFQSTAVLVDDIGLFTSRWTKNKRGIDESHGNLTSAVRRSKLSEVDLETGKVITLLGEGYRYEGGVSIFQFLAPPEIRGSTWYITVQSDGAVRLLSLDRKKYESAFWEHLAKKDRYVRAIAESRDWETKIVQPSLGLPHDSHRRIHALYLVRSNDSLITPTNLGRVVAVDAKDGKIKWTHEYAPLDAKRFPTFAPEWVVVPPVVVGDKYVYAPADFPELLCLNVADGKKVWSVKKGDGLYPAVVGEQVLVVGEKTLRSLNLKDGSERWKVDLPGLPCGRGAMLGEHYLAPVSEPKTWRGMIAMVDVKNGKITEVLKPEKDEPIGNLVVHQEFLISQTLTEIAVFPIRK
jgi:hypothetical protein